MTFKRVLAGRDSGHCTLDIPTTCRSRTTLSRARQVHSRSAEPSKIGVAMMEGADRVAGRSSAGVAEGPASIRWAPGTTDQPLDAGPHDAGWLPHGPRRYVLSSYSNVTRQSRIWDFGTARQHGEDPSLSPPSFYAEAASGCLRPSAGSVPEALQGQMCALPSRPRAQPRASPAPAA